MKKFIIKERLKPYSNSHIERIKKNKMDIIFNEDNYEK